MQSSRVGCLVVDEEGAVRLLTVAGAEDGVSHMQTSATSAW